MGPTKMGIGAALTINGVSVFDGTVISANSPQTSINTSIHVKKGDVIDKGISGDSSIDVRLYAVSN